uniref:phage tail protein n=1 Tax=Paenibacillus ihumii TaxID=687436 RepID=UPI0037097AD0
MDQFEVPTASLTEAGIVQLSNATNSTSEALAATPRAVKSAFDTATAAQNTANAANAAAAAAETPSGAQSKVDAHANLTSVHGAVSTATANRLILRDAAGRAKVAAPAAADDIARKDTVDNAVGTLSNLLTTAKGNAVAAINELFTNVSNGKTQIASAITGKGVPASGSDTFPVLAQKIGQIQTNIEDVMQETSDMIARIQAYLSMANGSYLKVTLDSHKNILFRNNLNKIVVLNKNMVPIYESADTFAYDFPVISPDGQYFFTLYRIYASGYYHRIAKYTTLGVKVWETERERYEQFTRDIATNGNVLVCLWADGRLEFLNASNGALIRTVALEYTGYDNVLWDEGLGMFVCLERQDRMAFVRTDGTIYKTTTTLAESQVERRHLSKNIYKYIYGRELYPRTQF